MRPFRIYNLHQDNWKALSQLSGEKKLCRAIILQALMDCARPLTSTNRRRWRDIARRWILSDRHCPWSFLWCVENGFEDDDIDRVIEVCRKNVIREERNGKFWDRLLRRSSLRELSD